MAKKKIYMTATATAAITAALFGAEQVDAATHEVKSGDTLWSLAQKYDTTVAQLKQLNNLSSDLIITKDILEVGDGQQKATSSSSSTKSTSSSKTSSTTSSNNSSGTYTVKSGDTLYAIASKHGMSVDKLMNANNLSSTMIHPGDKLSVNGSSASSTSSSNNSSSNNSNSSSSSSNSSSSTNKTNSSSSSSTSTSTNSTTYTIKSGDTLGQIAANHKVSVDQLKSWNNLSSHLIFPGDKLTINGKSSSTSSSSNSNNNSTSSKKSSSSTSSKSSSSSSSSSNNSSSSNSSSSSSSTTTYTVKSGDSLSTIASNHGVSVNNLMSWNNLSSTLIFPGNKLAIKESAKKPANNNSNSSSNSSSSSNASSSSNSNTDVKSNSTSSSNSSGGLISTAKSVQGTPYVWGGTTPGGFDCSGFIHWAHNNSGKSIPRTSVAGYDNRSYEISNPQVGDLVFFRGTYGGPNHMSHMGIYLGGGNFIHASSSQGVSIANVNNVYWSQYFDSYKRFY